MQIGVGVLQMCLVRIWCQTELLMHLQIASMSSLVVFILGPCLLCLGYLPKILGYFFSPRCLLILYSAVSK